MNVRLFVTVACILWVAMPRTILADEWGYEGARGPDHWASLSEANVLCAAGRQQSPIDLVETLSGSAVRMDRLLGEQALNLDSRAHVMDLVDNGHTIQVSSDAVISTRVEGDLYQLVQFHFHAPSEHMLSGRRLPLESHFVMANASGDLAVLGVLYEEGPHDPSFDPILAALPDGPGDDRHLEDLDLDMGSLKPLPQRYFRYSGSLTTPPCSENVQWIVVADVQSLSVLQIESLASHLHDNNRPIQPRNGRDVALVHSVDPGIR